MKDSEKTIEEVIGLIGLKQEGSYWDFKREWHKNNSDLLHDIICMANNLANRDAYIIIGVDEENDFCLNDTAADLNRKNTQKVVDFLREKKFSGGIRPTVYVVTFSINDVCIDVIVIEKSFDTPFYLTQSFQGVNANNIYVRVMDTNTPKTASADRNHIEMLWKKHFRLDATPLERITYYLKTREDWVNSESESTMYYRHYPEFTISHESNEKSGYEHYLFEQTDSTPHWYDITIKYHHTVIASLTGLALDGGRCFTVAPNFAGFHLENPYEFDVTYRCMLKNSLEDIVKEFYYEFDGDEATHAYNCYMDCILLFESEQEQNEFEQYVVRNKKKFLMISKKARLPYFPELEGYKMEVFKKRLADTYGLQEMLSEYRIESTKTT